MSFLIFKNSIQSLEKASFLGVVGITIFFVTFIFIFIYKAINGLSPQITVEYLKPNGSTEDILSSISNVFLAFTFQSNVFPIFQTLKSKKKNDMVRSTIIGVSFCLVIFLIAGIIGLLMYGINIKGSVLESLDNDIEKYKETDQIILVSVIIINIAFLISSTMSIPIMFFALKKNFINSVIFCNKKFSKNNNNSSSDKADNKAINSTTKDDKDKYNEILLKTVIGEFENNEKHRTPNENRTAKVTQTSKNIIIVILYCFITVCTILIPGLDTVIY